MKRSDFEAGLRELDDASASTEVPADVDARLRERLFSERPARFRWWLPVGAAVAALIVTVVVGLPARNSVVGGFEVESGARAEVTASGTVQARAGAATLTDVSQQAQLQLVAGAEVSRLTTGARVHSGKVRFDVVHTGTRAAAYQVEVSGGVIDVLGTAFTIAQGDGAGSVSLERGSIRFRATDGREVMLVPGQSLSWPLAAPPPEPAVDVPVPAVVVTPPVAVREPVVTSEAALEKVAALRTRGRYEEAVDVLEKTLEQPRLTASTRERLSYEIGSILTHQLHDPARACAYWAAHPSQRYAVEVNAAARELGCEKK